MNSMRDVWQRILTMQKHKFPSHVQINTFSWDEKLFQNET